VRNVDNLSQILNSLPILHLYTVHFVKCELSLGTSELLSRA